MNNNIQSNDIVYTVYTWNNEAIRFAFYLDNSHLNNSKQELEYIDPDKVTIAFKDYDNFLRVANYLDDNTLIFQRMIYKEDELDNSLTANANYNPIYFVNQQTFAMSVNYDNNFTMVAYDWKGFIEDKRILTHNVFYTEATLPTDPDDPTKKTYPDDYNKIKMYSMNMDEQLKYFYMNDIINPYAFAKGVEPPRTTVRQIAHLGINALTINDTMFDYDTLQERKSLLEYKKKYYNTILNNGEYKIARVDCKLLDKGDGTFGIAPVYNPQNTIVIDYKFSLDDVPSFSYDVSNLDYANAIYVESDSDDFDYKTKIQRASRDITTFEYYDTSTNDDGDTTSIQSYANEQFYKHREKITRSVEILFNTKVFLKDIKIGDIIELQNFMDGLNGKYIITKLTEVIEGNSLRYSIDEMEFVK